MIERHFFGIDLTLADQVGSSHGDTKHAYHLHLPLTVEGHVDASAFLHHADAFRVVRRRRGETDQHGKIMRDEHGSWTFQYEGTDHGANDTSFRLSEVHFAPGRYLSVTEDDGATRAFRVASVKPD